jgi:hypothetical protein
MEVGDKTFQSIPLFHDYLVLNITTVRRLASLSMCTSTYNSNKNAFVSAISFEKAKYHTTFGDFDLHTPSLLLKLFDADRLIRHGLPWPREKRCGRTP